MAVKTNLPPCGLGTRAQLEGRTAPGPLGCQSGGSPGGAVGGGAPRKKLLLLRSLECFGSSWGSVCLEVSAGGRERGLLLVWPGSCLE